MSGGGKKKTTGKQPAGQTPAPVPTTPAVPQKPSPMLGMSPFWWQQGGGLGGTQSDYPVDIFAALLPYMTKPTAPGTTPKPTTTQQTPGGHIR